MDELEEQLRAQIQRRGTVENAEPAEQRDLSVAENTLTHAVIGAAIEVHRHLGPGFLESVYEQAFALELDARSIKFRRQAPIPILYKSQWVGESRLDLIIEDQLVIELKAVAALEPIHGAQMLSYLKAGNFRVGLLINFNVRLLRHGVRRVVLTNLASAFSAFSTDPRR